MSRGERLRFVPAALLVAVACAQIVLAHKAQLAPWLGGGFGMFSTTDILTRRHLHAFVLYGGVRRETALPPDALREVMRAAAFPSQRHLRALARRIAASPSRSDGALESIEVQVWGVRYGEGLAPSGVLLAGARIEAGEL